MLTREAILNSPGPAREKVDCPALGGEVYVRQITVGERDVFEAASGRLKAADRKRLARARIVALVTVDEAGEPLFREEDVEALAGKPNAALEPIVDAHVRLNEMTRRDAADLEKN